MSRMSGSSVVVILFVVLAMATITLVSCAGTQTKSVSSNHPEVDKNPMCGECHDGKGTMNHDKQWSTKHEFTRNPQKPDCILCHGDIPNCGGMCHPS